MNIYLRRLQASDINAIHEATMQSHAELSCWMPWCHDDFSRADTVRWVERQPDAWEASREWNFVIVDDNDKIMGACGIHRIDVLNRVAEAGYWVRTSATSQGIGTTAVRQLCQWAFEEKELRRIEMLVAVENLSSQRVAEKAGGTREGIVRQRFLLRGRHHDGILYAILNPTCLESKDDSGY